MPDWILTLSGPTDDGPVAIAKTELEARVAFALKLLEPYGSNLCLTGHINVKEVK